MNKLLILRKEIDKAVFTTHGLLNIGAREARAAAIEVLQWAGVAGVQNCGSNERQEIADASDEDVNALLLNVVLMGNEPALHEAGLYDKATAAHNILSNAIALGYANGGDPFEEKHEGITQ